MGMGRSAAAGVPVSVPAGRLQQVLEHWMPRMQTAGITAGDAARLVAQAGEWPQWCATWSREAERHIVLAQAAQAQGRSLTAGEAYARAALFLHFAQFMFFDDLAQKEQAARRKVEVYRRAAPLLSPPALPVAVSYAGGTLNGYLRRPGTSATPLVIIIPGSDSTKEEFPSLEEYFLRRGLATFSVDGPGQGEGRSHGALTPDWAPVLRAVVDTLKSAAGVNGAIGIMGMAFGGHLALQGAYAVPELKALVCMNGFYDMGAFWDALPEVYRANMRFSLDGADLAQTREHARRFTLANAPAPACPALVVHGALDKIFPLDDARRIVQHVPRAEMVEYAEGNHVCNNVAYQYRALIADWLAEKLGAAASTHPAKSSR